MDVSLSVSSLAAAGHALGLQISQNMKRIIKRIKLSTLKRSNEMGRPSRGLVEPLWKCGVCIDPLVAVLRTFGAELD